MEVFHRRGILEKHFEKNFLLDHNEFRLKDERFKLNVKEIE
jgi:hypothetical protein